MHVIESMSNFVGILYLYVYIRVKSLFFLFRIVIERSPVGRVFTTVGLRLKLGERQTESLVLELVMSSGGRWYMRRDT